MTKLLSITNLQASYGPIPALLGVDLVIEAGQIAVILGANGAGKTTIIKSILGLIKVGSGSVRLDGERELIGLGSHQIHEMGIAWVPEGRRLWAGMTVMENLTMGAFASKTSSAIRSRIDTMFDRFPRLRERQGQMAGSLSGGEQQMVAIARALIAEPRLILMDEPSLGLAPIVVRDVFRLVKEINQSGVSILMVEQNARQALKVADSVYLLEAGRVVEHGRPEELMRNTRLQDIFLGGPA